MSLTDTKQISEHLIDVRNLVLKSAIAWIVWTVVAFFFSNQLIEIITHPITSRGHLLHFLSPTDTLFFVINTCALAGILGAFPFIMYFIWQYINPILRDQERIFLIRYTPWAFVLLSLGIVFGYIFVVPASLGFLLDITPAGTTLNLTTSEYTGFLFSLLIVMVLAFQAPLVVFGLIKSGLVPKSFFTSKRKEFYFGILVFMAAFGSPDAISWIISTGAVITLFEGALLLSTSKEKP